MNNVEEEETWETKNNLSSLIKVEDGLQQRKEASSSPVELSLPLPRDSIFHLQVLEDSSSNLLLVSTALLVGVPSQCCNTVREH